MWTAGQQLQLPEGGAWLCAISPSMALSGLPSFLLQGTNFPTHSVMRFYFMSAQLWLYDGSQHKIAFSKQKICLRVISAKTNPLFSKREGRRGGGPLLFLPLPASFPPNPGSSASLISSCPLISTHLYQTSFHFIEAGTWKSSISSNLSNIWYFSHSTLLCTCLMSGSRTILENPKGQLGALDHLSQHLLCPTIPFNLRQHNLPPSIFFFQTSLTFNFS